MFRYVRDSTPICEYEGEWCMFVSYDGPETCQECIPCLCVMEIDTSTLETHLNYKWGKDDEWTIMHML